MKEFNKSEYTQFVITDQLFSQKLYAYERFFLKKFEIYQLKKNEILKVESMFKKILLKLPEEAISSKNPKHLMEKYLPH